MQTFISREQDYALRIVARLAELAENVHMNMRQIATDMFISLKFAAKIIHNLKIKGFIGTVQGKHGGVYLKQNPDNISVYDILSSIGFKVRFNQCLCDDESCVLLTKCRFHSFFENEEKELMNKFKQMKISEFIFMREKNNKGGN